MPRFRFIKPPPDVLAYRGGQRLLLHRYVSVYSVEILAYKKDVPGSYSSVVLCRAEGRVTLAEKLDAGFDVPAGGPPEKIMQSLVAAGYAKLVIE